MRGDGHVLRGMNRPLPVSVLSRDCTHTHKKLTVIESLLPEAGGSLAMLSLLQL